MLFDGIAYLFAYAIAGLLIGFVGGMVGLVLGVVRYPLVLGAETTASIAAGTNLGISTLGSIAAAISHYRQNNVDFQVFITMAITGAIGAFIGSFLTKFVPMALLLGIIGVIVSYEAFSLIKNSNKTETQSKNKPSCGGETDFTLGLEKGLKSRSVLIESSIGFAVGFLGGLVGLVLGSIRMPAMISILKLKPKIAVGTNLASASVMGTIGFIGHVLNNNVDYLILMVMGPNAMIGAYLGARYTNRFSDSNLKLIIGIVLVVVAVFMFWRVFGYHLN
jgi:uncharacterized membrane protein YfcA